MSGRQSAAVDKVMPKRIGRPPLPESDRRTDRISQRTYTDVADKVRRNGAAWLEAVVRRAKDKPAA